MPGNVPLLAIMEGKCMGGEVMKTCIITIGWD